jgi:hypothetical protein
LCVASLTPTVCCSIGEIMSSATIEGKSQLTPCAPILEEGA